MDKPNKNILLYTFNLRVAQLRPIFGRSRLFTALETNSYVCAHIAQYVNFILVRLHRTVFSTRSSTTLHFVYSMQETYVPMAIVLAIDGILHLMAQNVQSQQLLKELFGFLQPLATPIVTAILKVTVTRFLKVTYAWDSGLANVRVIV